jgi:tetratricopeptide (TPR) repeat protein
MTGYQTHLEKNILFLRVLRYQAVGLRQGILFLFCIGIVFLFNGCSTKRNTFVHRGYHNLTARYNGYYYSNESISEGVYKLKKNNKENYDRLLPVFVIPTNENVKATFPEFDKAIKKSSLVIQRHAIKDKKGDEIPTAGRWIDNNWINIGIAHYYKREFFSGVEALDYVARTYKTKDRYKALLWLARTYNEVAVSQSDPILSTLSSDKKVPSKIKNRLQPIRADYYIKRGLYKEAIQALTQAVNEKGLIKTSGKKDRARYAFIIAQLYEKEKEYKKARQYYNKTISLKPAYDMVFYANIKLARLVDVNTANTGPVKKKLLRMTRDEKNFDYLDVIYYTLGEIEEKEKNVDQAIAYYKLSAKNSVTNPNQKALAFLKLGEISFDRFEYPLAGSYYDSTVATLQKDHPDYENIQNRKKTLDVLIGYINTIHYQDSLLQLANMSEAERNRAIDKIIARLEDEEQRLKEKQENALANNETPVFDPKNPAVVAPAGGGSGWYFYNQTTISFGISDFQKRWGNRKLEDNWRRSQKGLTIENIENPNEVITPGKITDSKGNVVANSKQDPRKTREYYIKRLPLSDTLQKVANNRIVEAYYLLGTTYKEELNNNRRAIGAFEELNKRYSDHKYLLSVYYQLYRLYNAERNQQQADFYKEKLLTQFPESEYAKLIRNPKYADELNAQRSEVEKFYGETYEVFAAGDYEKAYRQATEAFNRYGKNDFLPKFEFIRAMSLGRLKGIDTLEAALKQFVVLYPKSEVTPRAHEVLLAIKKQKDPSLFSQGNTNMPTDTFTINFDAPHFALIISPDDPKIANPYKSAIDEFDRTYYSNKVFSITSNLFASAQQMIVVKQFANAREAYSYLENLKNDTKIYTGAIKKEAFTFFIISAENLPVFFRKGSANSYRIFYEEAYKTVFSSPNK